MITTISGTDIGAIMGYNDYKTSHDVWVEKKTGQRTSVNNHRTKIGLALEAYVAKEYVRANSAIGTKLRRNGRSFTKGFMTGTPDYFVKYIDGSRGLIEVKTSAYPWDYVPKHYELQCRWYMALLNIETCVLVHYCLATDECIGYLFSRDYKIEQIMLKDAEEFVKNYLIGDAVPFNPATKKENDDIITCSDIDELYRQRIQLKEQQTQVDVELKRTEEKIKQIINSNYGAKGELFKFTYNEQMRESIDYDRIVKDHNVDINNYKSNGKTFRVLRGSRV